MSRTTPDPNEARVLVLAPLGRDARLLCRTITQVGIACQVCSAEELQAELALGVGVLLLTEEALTAETIATVKQVVETQPDWSDLPLVLLVSAARKGLEAFDVANSTTVLERPTRMPTLVTVVRSALTARRRQYQLRELLKRQSDLNAQLEVRVAERTAELHTANAELKKEIVEHENAKHELLASEGRFGKAFRVGPVAATITTRDEGRFLDVNESFMKLTGYSHGEVVGETDHALKMWSSAEDQAKLTAALRGDSSYHDLELQIKTKEGNVLDILASAEAIEVDATPCLLHMFYDITERKQTEGELLQAIHEVMQDAAWFSRSLMEKLAQARAKRTGQNISENEIAELTKREKQVLELIARGRSNAAIAAELNLVEQTVRNYITNLYEKIGVHSRAEAVVWARERGLASF